MNPSLGHRSPTCDLPLRGRRRMNWLRSLIRRTGQAGRSPPKPPRPRRVRRQHRPQLPFPRMWRRPHRCHPHPPRPRRSLQRHLQLDRRQKKSLSRLPRRHPRRRRSPSPLALKNLSALLRVPPGPRLLRRASDMRRRRAQRQALRSRICSRANRSASACARRFLWKRFSA